jgi:predicted ATP-binding protein involved in virulence
LATRVKVWLSADEWNIIKAAIDNGAAIPVDASKDVLSSYHYALHQQARQLAKERSQIRKRRESVSAASKAMHEACSNASYTKKEGTTGTDREWRILSIQIEEISLGTLNHISYQSMSKATLCQRHPKQHS